jgi:hypothetical protein
MRHCIRIFLRSALGLTALIVLAAAFQVQATSDHSGLMPEAKAQQPGVVLLAQKTEPVKEKKPLPVEPAQEPKQLKTMGTPPSPAMEKMDKSVIRGTEPEKAGTKKLGGQTIRAKETPGGE